MKSLPSRINVAEVKRQLCLKRFSWFVRESWPVLEPTTRLEWNWHLDALCDHVQAVVEGWMNRQLCGTPLPIQNLLATVPPGSMKSRTISVDLLPWIWLRFPSFRAIFLSANPRVTLRDAVFCRELIQSDWYRTTFRIPWELSEDQNAKSNFKNTAGGSRMSIGVNAKFTGDRGDALIVDDPHDASEVQSDAIRQGVLDWWDQTACNRVNDLTGSIRVGIMQRLHDNDWAAHVLRTGEWEHLCIKQEFEPGKTKLKATSGNGEKKLVWVDEATSIGWRDPRSKAGELMFPKRFPADVLESERRRLGSSGYAGQHQQDPMAADGNCFKKSWFQYWEDGGDHFILHDRKRGVRKLLKRDLLKKFGTHDFAFSIKENADYTVFGAWGVTPWNELILLDLHRARMEDPDAERELEIFCKRNNLDYAAIEDKQNGSTILQRIGRHNRIRTRSLKADVDKKTRASSAIIDCENGLFFFPMRATWLQDYETELLQFPNGSHDDQVDVTSYAAIEKSSGLSKITSFGDVSGVNYGR